MIAYEFYRRDVTEGSYLLGILPERRSSPERITPESIMNWGRIILGESVDLSNLSFIQVTINENGDGIFYPEPSF
jgi:hypothetical protein